MISCTITDLDFTALLTLFLTGNYSPSSIFNLASKDLRVVIYNHFFLHLEKKPHAKYAQQLPTLDLEIPQNFGKEAMERQRGYHYNIPTLALNSTGVLLPVPPS